MEILKDGRTITDANVLECLAKWRFRKNKARQNVLPAGEDAVFSDTLGLVIHRVTKQAMLDATSKRNPSMLRLLAVWLRGRQPVEFAHPFPFTSVNVNYAYACVSRILQA